VRTASRKPQQRSFLVDGVDGRPETVEVAGTFSSTAAAVCNDAVVLGLGIGAAPLWQVRPPLDAGHIELLVTAYEAAPIQVHALWPAASVQPGRTTIFVDFLASRLAVQRL